MSAGRVLVVDDAADLRLLARLVLANAGWEVVEAAGGSEALEVLASGDVIDVVVLDVQMPEMDGWHTLSTIREDPVVGRLPVVMCTVKEHPRDELRAWDCGADGYLVKPFSVDELIAIVEAAARRDDEERERARATNLRATGWELAVMRQGET